MALVLSRLNPTAKNVQSHLATFRGSKKVYLPCKEREKSPHEYLKEVDRVVKITFQEPARVQHIEGSLWRARLITLPILTMSATPVCDIRVTFDEAVQVLKLQSQHMSVELHGGPDLDINFSLRGELSVADHHQQRHRARSSEEQQREHSFQGFVALTLAFNLPFPLSLLPDRAVKLAGDAAMETILGSIERDLSRGIIKDYNSWCHEEQSLIDQK